MLQSEGSFQVFMGKRAGAMVSVTQLGGFVNYPFYKGKGFAQLKFVAMGETIGTRFPWTILAKNSTSRVVWLETSYARTASGNVKAIVTDDGRTIDFKTVENIIEVYLDMEYPEGMAASDVVIGQRDASDTSISEENWNPFTTLIPKTSAMTAGPDLTGRYRQQIILPIGVAPMPIISSIGPEQGPNGTQLNIIGHNFINPAGNDIDKQIVKLGDSIMHYSVTMNGSQVQCIRTTVILAPGTYPVSVTVNGHTATGGTFTVVSPMLIVTPEVTNYSGGIVTNPQYKKNDGPWMDFTSPVKILATDVMSFKSTINRVGSYMTTKGTIEVLTPNKFSIQTSTEKMFSVSLAGFTSANSYVVKFTAKSGKTYS